MGTCCLLASSQARIGIDTTVVVRTLEFGERPVCPYISLIALAIQSRSSTPVIASRMNTANASKE